MTFRGAQHDLETQIAEHLFIVCANNSGTTFLKAALATSRETWNLPLEGQTTFGYAGPSVRSLGIGKVWAARPEWVSTLSDASLYDWESTRRAWYFQALSRSAQAQVFVEKSPQNVLIVDQLATAFRSPRFLFMVRNPYATVEGIVRRLEQFHGSIRRRDMVGRVKIDPEEDSLTLATQHVATCLEAQRRNVETHQDNAVQFTYEQMCDDPKTVEAKIKRLVPALDDLILDQILAVKDYNERLCNMNGKQIARLSSQQIDKISKILAPHQSALAEFGYDLM